MWLQTVEGYSKIDDDENQINELIQSSIEIIKIIQKQHKQKISSFKNRIEAQVNLLQASILNKINFMQKYLLPVPILTQQPDSAQSKPKLFRGSKVIVSQNQIYTIKSFFSDKLITNSQLLYRASDNSFSTKIFHQKCDNIAPTLTILQTQFNKKIGGFTPVKWITRKTGSHIEDQSGQSFMFSLTNQDRFDLKSKKQAIFAYEMNGPVFGGCGNGYDLYIFNKANVQNSSYSTINQVYQNVIYKAMDRASRIKFSGAQDRNFKIKESQVWRLDLNPLKQENW